MGIENQVAHVGSQVARASSEIAGDALKGSQLIPNTPAQDSGLEDVAAGVSAEGTEQPGQPVAVGSAAPAAAAMAQSIDENTKSGPKVDVSKLRFQIPSEIPENTVQRAYRIAGQENQQPPRLQPQAQAAPQQQPAAQSSGYEDFLRDVDLGNIVGARQEEAVSLEQTMDYIEASGRQVVVNENRKKEAEKAESEQETKAAERQKMLEPDGDIPGSGMEMPDTFDQPRQRRKRGARDVSAPGMIVKSRVREEKQATRDEVAQKQWDGNSFKEKVAASRTVEPRAISVGSSVIMEMIREPGNILIRVVNAATGNSFTAEELILDNRRFNEFIGVINSSEIQMVATKSPVQQPSSAQTRVLRVHYGRGILVHPTQVKSYNADFDGDDISVAISNLDDTKMFRSAMEYMIDIDGSQAIDSSFFPVVMLGDGDIHSFRKEFYKMYLLNVKDRIDRRPIADALYVIADATRNNGDPDKEPVDLDPLYHDLVVAMDDQAKRFRNHDRVLSYMLQNIYDTSNYIKQMTLAQHFEQSPEKMIEQIETPADGYISYLITDMSVGKLPPNFQDFLIGLNRYVGEIEGKNVMFRLGADVAKRIKFSSQTVMGESGAWELYQHTLECGMAMYMSNRASIGEQKGLVQQLMRNYVIGIDGNGVGYPANYPDVQSFLVEFSQRWNAVMGIVNASKVNYDMMLNPITDKEYGGWSNRKLDQAKYNLPLAVDEEGNLYIPPNTELKVFAKALKTVYGRYTMSKVFGQYIGYSKSLKDSKGNYIQSKAKTLLQRFRQSTVSRFCRCNNISVYERKEYIDDSGKKRDNGGMHKNVGDADFRDVMLSLADQRTELASSFNRSLDKMLIEMKRGLRAYAEKYKTRNENPADYEAFTNSLIEAMYLAGPDMYQYYGMENADMFLNSKWGKLFRSVITQTSKTGPVARSYARLKKDHPISSSEKQYIADKARADALGGIRMAMVTEYRLRRIASLNRSIDEVLRKEGDLTERDAYKINVLQNRIMAELDTLGASSDLWSILSQEVKGNNSMFLLIASAKGDIDGTFMDAKWYWEKQPSSVSKMKHKSLLDVMLDPDLTKTEKNMIAVDVVRYAVGFKGFKAYEMSYQLEIGPSSNHTSISTMAYRDEPDVIDDIQEAANSIKRAYENNFEDIKADTQFAYDLFRSDGGNAGVLNDYLSELAENPQAFLEIGDDMIVDAINAQMDKTSKSAEKAHQELPVAWLYDALMLQKGGFTNAMYRSSDRVLGRMSSLSISSYDLIQVLADPEMSMEIYDGENRWTLSRESLCGGVSEEDVWQMLLKNPRIAAMLRPGVASSLDSKSRRGAVHSYKRSLSDAMFDIVRNKKDPSEIISAKKRSDSDAKFGGMVKTYLTDRPMFLSLVAMMRKSHGRTSSSVRGDTRYSLYMMQSFIIDLSRRRAFGEFGDEGKKGEEKKKVATSHVKTVLKKTFGIDEKALKKAAPNMDDQAVSNWYSEIVSAIEEYTGDISAFIRDGSYLSEAVNWADRLTKMANGIKSSSKELSFDDSSIALAIDVHQTMTGAKTEKSTSIEGAMTQLNTGLGLYAMSLRDRHTILSKDLSDEELSALAGSMTQYGEFDGTRQGLEALSENLESGEQLVAEVFDPDWVKEDETLDHIGWQVPSVARWALVKRTKASEKFNLKVKKSGNDGFDSITKVRYANGISGDMRYDPTNNRGADNIGIIKTEYVENGLFAAKMRLARMMQDADAREGYDDMDISDYADIAASMIKQVADEGENRTIDGITIRSLEEISLAIRSKLDRDLIQDGTNADIMRAALSIADAVGTAPKADPKRERSLSLSLLNSISRSSSKVWRGKPTMMDAMSADERSIDMMAEVMSRSHKMSIPWFSDRLFNKKESRIAPAAVRSQMTNSIKNMIAGKAMAKKKKNPVKYAPAGIDFMGYISKSENLTLVSPGPSTVWYLDYGATDEQIENAIINCYEYGMTLVFPDVSCLGGMAQTMLPNITETSWGDQLQLPFFHMRLNGISDPDVAMAPASFQFDPSWMWFTVEDSNNVYGLGDSDALTSKFAAQRMQCVAADRLEMSADDMFSNTREMYKDKCGIPELATKEDIERWIINWEDDDIQIDVGMAQDNRFFENHLKKLKIQMAEYRRDFESADPMYGVLPEAKPDRIIGWMKMKIDGYSTPVLAPIIPWPTGSTLTAPTTFGVEHLGYDGDTDSVYLDWRNTERIPGQIAKIHDGMGGAGKSVTFLNNTVDLGRLRSGHNIDCVIASESFASRRLAWGKRMCTLKSMAMMMSLPPFGYNYAEHDSSFPDIDQELRTRLQTERIPMDEWPELVGRIGRFSTDKEVDALLKDLVQSAIRTGTTNPSDILATKIAGKHSFMYVDYDFFFEPSLEFQNTLMKWYNMMQPEMCPPSIDSYDNGGERGYLFKPLTDPGESDYDYGCMQMNVPGINPKTGETYYHWENVYISASFFNDDFSGLHKPGLNGAHRSMEQLNAVALSGRALPWRYMVPYAMNTSSIAPRSYEPYDVEWSMQEYGKHIK